MYTGYWIENGRIYGVKGYTRSWIENGHIHTADCEYPTFWIKDWAIHSTVYGDTGYTIENDYIYGPEEKLPWLEQQGNVQ